MTDTTPHIRRIDPAGSLMQQLEVIVESDVMWGLAEQLEAFHQSRGSSGPRRQYTLMDILVTSVAAQLCGSDRAAIRQLNDPNVWGRLCDAAAAVPDDSSRRLSPRAPSRYQLYRARQNHFSGDALEVLKRGMRAAAVRTAADLGAFDPSAGTWTRPDESQFVVGDTTWIPVSDHQGKVNGEQALESLVACEATWRPIELVAARHGISHRGLMDAIVMEVARSLTGTRKEAEQYLGDLRHWRALRRAAGRAFPNDPQRRLSPTAPSRYRHDQTRQRYLTGEALDDLKREVRREAVLAAIRVGMFDPAKGTATHPDATQLIAGDHTLIPTATNPYRTVAPIGRDRGYQLVVISCGTNHAERILLDAEVADADECEGRSDADRAVAMLAQLLDENGDVLRDGLKGFTYDMALASANLDTLLGMCVLPIAKVPRVTGGEIRRGVIGVHRFTAADASTHDLEVGAVNGAPVVEFTNHSGVFTTVALNRRRIFWAHGNQQAIAYGRYEIPADAADVPAHLCGATTEIRLNSIELDARGTPDTRRTRLLRPIPETDADFDRLYGIRENAESIFADLKSGAVRFRGSRDISLQVLVYQMLSIAKALAADHNHHKRAA